MRHQMLHLAGVLGGTKQLHATVFLRQRIRDLALQVELLLAADLERAARAVLIERQPFYWEVVAASFVGQGRSFAQMSSYAEAGIRQVVLWTDADGVHLTIGDRKLPYLRWADGGFLTLLYLLDIFGYLPFDSATNFDAYQLVARELLPALQTTDLRIVVNFPTP